jgi:hypothetical protein
MFHFLSLISFLDTKLKISRSYGLKTAGFRLSEPLVYPFSLIAAFLISCDSDS